MMLAGASDAVASAALQSRIEPMAAAAGVTIGSTEILPAETRGDDRRIGLRLIVTGTYGSLVKLSGAILGYLLLRGVALAYRTLRRREGLGRGDAKLMAACGAWTGMLAFSPRRCRRSPRSSLCGVAAPE
jgi:hypothetical protein